MGTTSEKLTYLNTTKEKIRDSINLTGANIGTSDTFRSYATNLKKGYIDIINNGIDNLYNNFPKVSGIGSNLSLTPTYEAPIKLNEIQGDTLQDGTPTPDTPVEIQSVTGNQEIKVTGKNLCNNVALSNSNNDIFFYFDKNISQTFTLSATINSATSGNSIYLTLNGSSLGKVGEITGSANTKQSVTITFTNEIYEQIQNSTTRYLQLYKNNAGFTLPTDAQIENGSSNTDYEEYKGNTYEVNLGKNLFSSEMELGTLNNSTGLPATETNCIRTKDYIAVNSSTTYIISNNKDYQQIVYQYDSSYNLLSANTQNSSFTTTSTTKYIKLRTGVSNVENDLTSLWQLEKGSQATSYSPYFTPIELNKIGTYQDRIYKDNGKWYIEKQIGKVVLDSNLSGVGSTNFSNVYQIYANVMNISYLIGGFCDNFKFNDDSRIIDNNNANNYLSDNQCALRLGNESARDRFYVKSTNFASSNELKAYFNTNPTTLYYVLATPEYTEITNTELIEDLETLYTAKSQEGTTNISITSEDLEMILNVSALKGDA